LNYLAKEIICIAKRKNTEPGCHDVYFKQIKELLRWEEIARVVDNGGNVDYHYLSTFFTYVGKEGGTVRIRRNDDCLYLNTTTKGLDSKTTW